MQLGDLTIDTAKTFEGQVFDVALTEGGSIKLTLDEALPFENRQRRPARGAPQPKRAPFALYFTGAPSEALQQGMYAFSRAGESVGDIFIVPIGRDDTVVEYEAVFT